MGVGRGGEGEGSVEDTRTSTKRASNKDWKLLSQGKTTKNTHIYLG